MSPREYPIQVWMKSYVQRLGFSNPSAIADLVWKCSETPCPSRTFDEYGAKILFPLAHALLHNWKGRDSHTAFSVFAKRFGLSSLEPICWMQVHGADDTYYYALQEALKDSTNEAAITQEFIERGGWGIWMACTAAHDVLYEHLSKAITNSDKNLQGVRVTIDNARHLTQNIMSEKFQYINTSTREFILDEAQAIVNDFGDQMPIDVVVCEQPTTFNFPVWNIKKWAKGNPFMGWAIGDGTFTRGVDPKGESIGCRCFPTKQDAVKFAKEHGWNVVGFVP